jgi:DHA2 family multidrug resistance protein
MSPAPDEGRYRWQVLGVVMLGTVMSALDSSIVNVSLPSMMASFGASVDDIEWVVTGYMLGFSTFMPLTAWLRDRLGHRRLYMLSLTVFVLGSLLCGLAWNLPVLIAARVIQAFGGGAITPTGMAMIAEVFPPKERGRALGIWGVGVIVGPALGPTLGGYLTQTLGWRSIFDINLPIGVVGLLAASRLLRPDRPAASEHRPFDVPGFVTLTTFLVALLYGLSKGNHSGWTSALVVGCGLIAAFSLVAFLVVESVTTHRILDLGLLRHGQFSVALMVVAVRSTALFGGVFLLPLFMQSHMGLSEVRTGALLLPGALVIGALMPVSGRLADRFGPRIPTVAGLALTALFMFMYRRLDANTSLWGVLAPTLIRGVGLGLLVTPVTTAALNAVPTSRAGMASSLMNLVQQVSGSIGIAALASVLGRRTVFHQSVVGESLLAGSSAWTSRAAEIAHHLRGAGMSPRDAALAAGSMLARHAAATASVAAFDDAFLVGSGVVLVGIVPAMFLATGRKARAPDDADALHALAD